MSTYRKKPKIHSGNWHGQPPTLWIGHAFRDLHYDHGLFVVTNVKNLHVELRGLIDTYRPNKTRVHFKTFKKEFIWFD